MTTKDELKCRISMALKDSVLQVGFEIICRENDKLEKENAELKKRNGELSGQKASLERWFGEAKSIIEELYNVIPASMAEYAKEPMEHARRFMTEATE